MAEYLDHELGEEVNRWSGWESHDGWMTLGFDPKNSIKGNSEDPQNQPIIRMIFFSITSLKKRFSVKLECFCVFSHMFFCLSRLATLIFVFAMSSVVPTTCHVPQGHVPCNEEWICRSPAMHSQLWPLMNRRAVHRRGFSVFVLFFCWGGLKNGKHVEVGRNARILDVRVNINVRMLGSLFLQSSCL